MEKYQKIRSFFYKINPGQIKNRELSPRTNRRLSSLCILKVSIISFPRPYRQRSIPEKAIKDIPVLRDDLTFAKLKQYLINKGIHINEETLYKNFGLVTADGKFNLLAEILADENMNSIKVAVFKGKDKSEFVKRNEYGYTCLIESLEKVINYCDALNETFIDVSVRPRREQRLFSSEAFKEA